MTINSINQLFLATLIFAVTSLFGITASARPLANDTNNLKAPLVDWNNGLQAVHLVQKWLKNGHVPGSAGSRKIMVTGLIGVKVTFRVQGATAGWAAAYVKRDIAVANSNLPVNLLIPLKQAAQAAFHKLKSQLGNARFNAIKKGIKNQVAIPEISDIANNIMVDIQLGHDLQKIRLPKNAKPGMLVHRFSPDWNGLMMLIGPADFNQYAPEKLSDASFIWPATAQSHNLGPNMQIISLLHQQDLDLKDLKNVARPGGARLWRFKVVHVLQPAKNMPVMPLVRGNVLLPMHSISSATLANIADNITAALHDRFLPGKQAVRGAYQPSTGQFKPAVAGPRATALACYALSIRAKQLLDLNPSNAQAKKMADLALKTVEKTIEQNKTSRAYPAALALGLLTLCDTPSYGVRTNLRNYLGQRIFKLVQNNSASSPAVAALLTASLAGWYEHTRAAQTRDAVAQSMQTLWKQMFKNPAVPALQWLMIAHQKMRRTGYTLDAKEAQKIHKLIKRLITTLIKRQITTAPGNGPADVVGGYQLRGLPSGAPPTPTWRTAQVMSIITLGLGTKGVATKNDRIPWVLSAGLAARFIGQLMVAPPSCWYINDKNQAMGNIRISPWDNNMPISPTAMSLFAVVQLQQLLNQVPSTSSTQLNKH